MFVGIGKLIIIIADGQSLKFKRQGVRKIKDRVHSKFNCSIGEVGDQNLWQKTTLGFSVVGTDKKFVDAFVQKIIRFIDQIHVGEIIDEYIEVFPFK